MKRSLDVQNKYWLGRWERGETGWHQSEFEQELIHFFSEMPPTRVLVPLCGKSLDLVWLVSQGHEVIGVELSENACQAFFDENKISSVVKDAGLFRVYRGDKLTLFCGDFFDFSPHQLGKIGAIYDRAALIALPSEMRVKYVAHIKALMKVCARPEDFRFLQLLWERNPHDLNGPPYSILPEEFVRYYEDTFNIRLIKREEIEWGISQSKTFQSVYHLSLGRV
ncbi:MAG: thiopurine S-methyltransferase [Bdellovibrionota bacterium]